MNMHVSFAAQTAPLSLLCLSTENVRHSVEDATAFADLKASILHHGLINPLVVTRAKRGKKLEVVAGGRRFRALAELATEGAIAADTDVAVQVVEQGDPEEISLVENFVRTQLKPFEIYRAFAQVQANHPEVTHCELAERFGMKPERAAKILRLGNLLPEILHLYAAGEIDEAQAQAFAATARHDLQAQALATFKNADRYSRSHFNIRKWILGDQDVMQQLRYVGRETYEAHGGTLEQDLFSESVRVVDADLLAELVTEKKQSLLVEYAARTTVPITLVSEAPKHKDGYTDYAREVRAMAVPFTAEQQARLDELQAIIENYESDSTAEHEAAEEEWDTIHDDQDWTLPDDKGELLVTIDEQGKPRFWTAGEAPSRKQEAAEAAGGSSVQASQVAIEEMGKMRRLLLRDAVLNDNNLIANGTFFLTFMVARQAGGRNSLQGLEHGRMILDLSFMDEAWMNEPDIETAYCMFEQSGQCYPVAAEITALMALPNCTPKRAGFPEWLAARRRHPFLWTSTPEFWDMFRKGQIMDMLDEVGPGFRRIYANTKQKEIREKAHQFCRGELNPKLSEIGADEREAAQAWCPKWLRLTVEDRDE